MSLGREFITGRDSLAVEAYRERLFAPLEFGEGRGRRALDLGCGDGLEAVYLLRRGWKVEGVDIEAHPRWKEIERRWKGKASFRTADAASLKKLKAGYDLVFEKDMLHHVPDPLAVLKEMKRLAKPGGRLVVVECNRYNPIFYLHLTLWGGHQHFRRGRLKELLRSAGMPQFKLTLREARVWPVENEFFQKIMDRAQGFIEAAKIFNPWICYHLISWEKTAKKP